MAVTQLAAVIHNAQSKFIGEDVLAFVRLNLFVNGEPSGRLVLVLHFKVGHLIVVTVGQPPLEQYSIGANLLHNWSRLGAAHAQLIAGYALVQTGVRPLHGHNAQIAQLLIYFEASHQRRLNDQIVLQPIDLHTTATCHTQQHHRLALVNARVLRAQYYLGALFVQPRTGHI
ncbi:hypothetical protein BpHYR1_030549 [Brachionus plicatilis]|uniref:Uncharacterized protein n=1 Tax=Brachionus plicatilis TaxID=10195 RepID=A0A3M7RJT5_BRAPC|nr:hypothetical protein BpHYR1_030549 [Brachionus plicatilis]